MPRSDGLLTVVCGAKNTKRLEFAHTGLSDLLGNLLGDSGPGQASGMPKASTRLLFPLTYGQTPGVLVWAWPSKMRSIGLPVMRSILPVRLAKGPV